VSNEFLNKTGRIAVSVCIVGSGVLSQEAMAELIFDQSYATSAAAATGTLRGS
jgi:hypothetical protein